MPHHGGDHHDNCGGHGGHGHHHGDGHHETHH